jgi:hypothetical protein
MTEYVEMAKQAMERPSDFGWFGREDMFETWGFTGVNRYPNGGGKSDIDAILDDSNFFCIKQHLEGKFPDSENIEEVGLNHWAAGSVDSIICKIIAVDPPPDLDDLDEDDLTDEFKEIADIVVGLRDDYPIFDEMDFSERESEYHYDRFIEDIPFEIDASKVDDVLNDLHERDIYIEEGVMEDDIFESAYAVGADDRVNCDEEWKAWEFLNPAEVARKKENNWRDAGQMRLIDAA